LAKRWPSLGVSLRLNVAFEFKRAGFLEGEAVGTTLLIAPLTSRRLVSAADLANSAVGLPVPHIQENRPL